MNSSTRPARFNTDRSSVPAPWMLFRATSNRRRHQAGFSLVELMLTVLMVAVLAGIALSTFGNTQDSARKLAIEGDATMLNKAVQAYQGNGGSLTGVSAPADVIAKLKTKPLEAQEQQIAGMKGPFVDLRLELVRAVAGDPWSLNFDPVTSTFSVTEGNGGYVPRISESLAEEPVATEARNVAMPLAKTDRWVWDYTNRAAPERSALMRPTGQDTAPTAPVNPTGAAQTLNLLPPTYSQPGFQLGPMDFPQLVSLLNPNPGGASEILFRINGGPWTKYSEAISLPLQASTKIEAYTSPIKQMWGPSTLATEIFTFLPGQLTPPVITPTGGSFAYDAFPKTVTLQDTNPTSTARLQYRIGEEAWVNYTGPVPISPELSVKLSARAIPLDSQRWVASTEVIAIYDLTQELLKSPVFSLAAGMYPATDYPLNISLTNPNPANSSTLQYREKGGTWKEYTTAIALANTQIDVTLEARALPIDSVRWIASPVRTSRYQLVKSQLKPPVVTPPGGYYPYNSFPSVVTIANPNPAGSSEIMYRFGSIGAFIKYNPSAPPALSKDNYQTTLTVYARSLMSAQFLDSNEGQELYETIYFSGATNGLFHNPIPDTGGNPQNLVTNLPSPKEGNLFKWGSINGSGLSQSTMQFDGTTSFKAAPGEWFFLGKLTYYNGTIVSGTGAGGINLKFAFNISTPTVTTTTADYFFKLINTKNTGTDAENADYVYLPTLGVPFATTVGGRKFKLDVRFGETTANGFGNVSEFHIYEGKSATGSLYGRITEVP